MKITQVDRFNQIIVIEGKFIFIDKVYADKPILELIQHLNDRLQYNTGNKAEVLIITPEVWEHISGNHEVLNLYFNTNYTHQQKFFKRLDYKEFRHVLNMINIPIKEIVVWDYD